MMSCILVFYILLCGAAGRTLAPGQPVPDPDALYAARADLASAREAARLWDARLRADPRDFEAAWKLARARYWLGGHAPDDERKDVLEAGIAAGRAATAARPNRPEGHFWMAGAPSPSRSACGRA